MYQFKRMLFGLTNAPATFQRLMDKVITPDLKPNVFSYLNDIIIVTENFEEHLKTLETVLEKINQARLTINLEKCECGCSELKYLGFVVNEKGLLMDEDKIKPILEFPTPKNAKQLQRIIGMKSWYRRFIPKFSEIMEPLHTLLKNRTTSKKKNHIEMGNTKNFVCRQWQRIRKQIHGEINAKLRNATFENATIPPTIKPNRKM